MSKQVMDINVLPEYIANTFGVSKVRVQNNNSVLTIEPLLADNTVSTNQTVSLAKPLKITDGFNNKPGILTFDDFKSIQLLTKNYKFNRDDAYERD
ncbi:MAG: hypothetical protein LBS60_14485 [Deltaproteobacteria bacterium]|jgi:hypothetical protein|nr:hypothetical protein [Deltaproteobacteria bacterium]